MELKRFYSRSAYALALCSLMLSATACSDDDINDDDVNGGDNTTTEELADEWYAGGKLGTTFNSSATAYTDPSPATVNAGLSDRFKYGEYFFERTYNLNTKPFNGLGPLYVRSSCMACHPGYGHGKRVERYKANDWGNGYLLVVTDKNDTYLSSLTGMPQTKANAPFKAPIDEDKIEIKWLSYTDEWGNQFPDGESYSLIYPEVTIPEDAYYVPLEVNNQPVDYSDVVVRLESTIGIYGTGLLDAITDEDLKAQYALEEKYGARINPSIFANGEWVKTYSTTGHPLRFTYALTRGPIQDGPGANAIWNITNVTRSDRKYHYMTQTYANTAANDPEVQAQFYSYFPEWNITGNVHDDIVNYLMNKDLPAEMTDEDYTDFMVWHRGLAVPAARDLDQEDVQLGKKLFTEIGCTNCHRPSWTTGDDKFTDPNGFFADGDARLPRYPHQTIWPYSDMVQHRLEMVNDIRTGWCRTTPLWGRGLSQICSGHSDRLHDCRARNVIEAIMWHGSATSDARKSVENFRALSKTQRDAVVKFINAV
jgi:CxxC motif-containing protein (DUF1111 family)